MSDRKISEFSSIAGAGVDVDNDYIEIVDVSAAITDRNKRITPKELIANTLSVAQSGTGAVSTDVQTELRRWVWVEQFGAVGNGTTDDTAAIQAAINTGNLGILFQGGKTYRASGLTQSTASQVLTCPNGVAIIKKNANGVLFTSSGRDVQCRNIAFYGDASSPTFTGDNINSTGDNFALINCGSRWTSGRAVKATGGHVQIIGTCDIYQTTDATGTGYDIEIGVSGTATIYHQLVGVYTSQSTGGIKLIDTGSATIFGGEFGKLYIAAGTGPAGVNGGVTVGARITSTTTVEVPDAIVAGNTHNDTVTFSATTSNCRFDGVLASGKTVTNSGTQNMIVNGANDGLQSVDGRAWAFANNVSVRFRKGDGTAGAGATAQFNMSSSNNFGITNNVTDGAISSLTTGTGDFQNFLVNGGTEVYRINGTQGLKLGAKRLQGAQGAAPASANNLVLGADGNRFQITGTTQINLLANTNWQGGAIVTLHFQGSLTVKHNQAISGANAPIMLAGAVDFSATANDQLTLQYDSTDSKWYEIARTVI